jgi:hypothetical protein
VRFLLVIGGNARACPFGVVHACKRRVHVQWRGYWHRGPLHCMGKCERQLWSTANLWDSTRNKPWSCPPLLQACIARCVAAKLATQH